MVSHAKVDRGLLTMTSERIFTRAAGRVPTRVTPTGITLLGFGLLLLAALGYYLGGFQRGWLLLSAFGVAGHWLTDNLDGAVARLRGATSFRGVYLDMFLDNAGGAVAALAAATASYAISWLVLSAYMLFLLSTILGLFWMMYRQQLPIPRVGPEELKLVVVFLTLATLVSNGRLVELDNHWLGWFDLAAIVVIPTYVTYLTYSAVKLYKSIDG